MGQHTSGANGDLEAPGPSELAVEAGTAASLPPNRGAAPGPEFGDGNLGGNLGHADPSYEDVVFHIEYLSDYRGKLNMRIFRFGMLICVVLLVLECVWQLSPSENQLSITLNEIYLNLVISSILIVIVLAVGGLFVYRVAAFRLAGKRMNLRRKRILTLVTIDLVSDLLILVSSNTLLCTSVSLTRQKATLLRVIDAWLTSWLAQSSWMRGLLHRYFIWRPTPTPW